MMNEELEMLLDKYGPEAIATALSEICHEKADHVRTNWQDEALARVWDRNGKEFGKCAGKVTA